MKILISKTEIIIRSKKKIKEKGWWVNESKKTLRSVYFYSA
jgi:hypothetical protein